MDIYDVAWLAVQDGVTFRLDRVGESIADPFSLGIESPTVELVVEVVDEVSSGSLGFRNNIDLDINTLWEEVL